MELVRLLNIRHYDPRRGRFTTLAFRKFGEGVSVVGKKCVEDAGRSLCDHIKLYYSSTAGDPPIFWVFPDDALPESAELVQEVSTTGDDCHYDVRGMTSGEEKRFFRPFSGRFDEFQVCQVDGGIVAADRTLFDQLSVESSNGQSE